MHRAKNSSETKHGMRPKLPVKLSICATFSFY